MRAATLVAVGDVSFGDNGVCASFGVDSMLRRNPRLDVFENVKGILQGHDLVFGNLETVLSEHEFNPARLRSKHMRGRPEYVDQLVAAGFNVLNVANNHILQHGERAFQETVDLLRSRGIVPVGLAGTHGAGCEPAHVHIRGTEIVFLGYAFEIDKYYRGVPLYAQTDLSGIVDDIARVKTNSNIVVCSFHWGREFISYPNVEQITIARAAVDAGCDLVLGHHPHVLNGFERYKDKHVFYSLGNFLFDQVWNDDCRESMAIHMRLAPGDVTFTGADGVRIGDDYRPALVPGQAFDKRLQHLCSQIRADLDGQGAEHARQAGRRQARNRYLSWRYLLTHLHRYDPVLLRQILGEAVSRRVQAPKSQGPSAERV